MMMMINDYDDHTVTAMRRPGYGSDKLSRGVSRK